MAFPLKGFNPGYKWKIILKFLNTQSSCPIQGDQDSFQAIPKVNPLKPMPPRLPKTLLQPLIIVVKKKIEEMPISYKRGVVNN